MKSETIKPRITVIIPCYNDGHFIEETIESIKEKEPIDIIIVNDGSNDYNTLNVLKKINKNNIKVINQENQGPAKARIAGYNAAKTKYIFPIDADDKLCEGVLVKMANILEKNKNIDFVFGDYIYFGNKEGIWKTPQWSKWSVCYGNFWSPFHFIEKEKVIKIENNVFSLGYEDWDFLMKLAENNMNGYHVGEPTYYRRLHKNRRQSSNRKEHKKLYKDLKQKHKKLFDDRKINADKEKVPYLKRVIYWAVLGHRYLIPQFVDDILVLSFSKSKKK